MDLISWCVIVRQKKVGWHLLPRLIPPHARGDKDMSCTPKCPLFSTLKSWAVENRPMKMGGQTHTGGDRGCRVHFMHQNQRRWIHQIPWKNEGRGWNGDGARSAPYGRSYSLYRPFPEDEDGWSTPIPVGVVVVGCILCTRTNGRKYTRFPGEMKSGDPSKMVHEVHPTGGDTNPSAFHEGKGHPRPAFEVFLPKWLRHPRLRRPCREPTFYKRLPNKFL